MTACVFIDARSGFTYFSSEKESTHRYISKEASLDFLISARLLYCCTNTIYYLDTEISEPGCRVSAIHSPFHSLLLHSTLQPAAEWAEDAEGTINQRRGGILIFEHSQIEHSNIATELPNIHEFLCPSCADSSLLT